VAYRFSTNTNRNLQLVFSSGDPTGALKTNLHWLGQLTKKIQPRVARVRKRKSGMMLVALSRRTLFICCGELQYQDSETRRRGKKATENENEKEGRTTLDVCGAVVSVRGAGK
jgi:hypothetical protein